MSRYLILAQSDESASALEAWARLLKINVLRLQESAPAKIVVDLPAPGPEGSNGILEGLVETIVAAAGLDGEASPSSAIVLVDTVRPDGLDPVAEGAAWDTLVAQLILAFPEIRWIFGTILGSVQGFPERECSLMALTALPSSDALFDGTGLRRWVRGIARRATAAEGLGDYLPEREKLALAIDDEPSYAYFNAYAAYRFGFRSQVVCTEEKLAHYLGRDGHAGEDLMLTFEDLFLNFPDRQVGRLGGSEAVHLSDLKQRDAALPMLEKRRPRRVFVTTGHRKGTDHVRGARNTTTRLELARRGQLGTEVSKPLAGVFDLWNRAGLTKGLRGPRGSSGLAPGYVWPPRDLASQDERGGSHSAPGKLLRVAGWLISRSEQVLGGEIMSVAQAVRGAVLATEALELLGGRTPTTSLQALSLRHQLEVLAECRFHGVGAHFDVRSRMKDVALEIRALSVYFGPENRKLGAWSAEASILARIIQIFRDHDQFDEELKVQARSRSLHRRMWFKSQKWWGPLGDQLRWINPAYWVVRYVHLLIASVPTSIVCIALWISVLAAIHARYFDPSQSIAGHLSAAAEAFVGASGFGSVAGSTPSDLLLLVTTSIAVVGGVLHFGIILSHLYSLLARK